MDRARNFFQTLKITRQKKKNAYEEKISNERPEKTSKKLATLAIFSKN